MTLDCITTQVEASPDKDLIGLDGTETFEQAKQKLTDAQVEIKRQKELSRVVAEYVRQGTVYIRNAELRKVDPWTALSDILTGSREWEGKAPGFASLESRIFSVNNKAHSMIADIMKAGKPTKAGFGKSNLNQELLIRAIRGVKIEDAYINDLANSWHKLTVYLADRFNRAGGRIRKLKPEDFAMPQTHDIEKFKDVGVDVWKAHVQPLLDKKRVMESIGIDPGSKNADRMYQAALDVIFDTVSKGKLKTYTPDTPHYTIQRRMANRHQASRILHFFDGDAFVKYQKLYGDEDYYKSMLRYIDTMSKEIAAMEMLGPNPEFTIKKLSEFAESKQPYSNIKNLHKKPINQYDDMMGNNIGENNALSKVFMGAKNIAYGSTLGSAAITAMVTDPGFIAITAKMNGMKAFNILKRSYANMLPNAADKETGIVLGVITDHMQDLSMQGMRYGDSIGVGLTAKYASFVMVATLLDPWTKAAKLANSMGYLEQITSNLSKAYGQIPKNMRGMLKRYGINEAEWAKLQKTPLYVDRNGAKFVDLRKIGDDEIQAKLVGGIYSETKHAVPEPDARVRAAYKRGTKGGTIWGESIKSSAQLKTFGLTMLMTNIARISNMSGGSRVGYAAAMFIGTTMLGTLSYILNEVSRGRTVPLDDPWLPVRGFERGGSLGVINDFVSSGFHARGLLAFGAGPVFQTADEIATFMFGTVEEFATMEGKVLTRLGMGLSEAARKSLGLWQVRLILRREVFDQINKEIDPNWSPKQRRIRTNLRKRTGQKHWWRQGKNPITKTITGSGRPQF